MIHKVNFVDIEKGVQYWVHTEEGDWFVGEVDGEWMVSMKQNERFANIKEVFNLMNPDEIISLVEEQTSKAWQQGAKHGITCN